LLIVRVPGSVEKAASHSGPAVGISCPKSGAGVDVGIGVCVGSGAEAQAAAEPTKTIMIVTLSQQEQVSLSNTVSSTMLYCCSSHHASQPSALMNHYSPDNKKSAEMTWLGIIDQAHHPRAAESNQVNTMIAKIVNVYKSF